MGASSAPMTKPAPTARRARKLLEGPILLTLLGLAAPNFAVMIAQTAASFAESYYVGLLGTEALAGAALVFPLFMLMQMMSAGGMGGGISSAVARAVGGGRLHDAEALVLHAVVIAIGFGLTFSAAALLGGPALYRAMGGRGAALEAAIAYSNTVFLGATLLWLLNSLANVLRGSGNMVLPAQVLGGGGIAVILLAPLLMFGWGPCPASGSSAPQRRWSPSTGSDRWCCCSACCAATASSACRWRTGCNGGISRRSCASACSASPARWSPTSRSRWRPASSGCTAPPRWPATGWARAWSTSRSRSPSASARRWSPWSG